MRYGLNLILILCLTLTGVGLGVARGTVQIDGQVVICTGEGIVLRVVPGTPARSRAHICPDMALSLLDVVAGSDLAVTPVPLPRQADPAVNTPTGVSRSVPVATARDPPPVLVAI